MTNNKPVSIESITDVLATDALAAVTGGCAACGNPAAQCPAPSASQSGMAPPKYSAGWWDAIRGSGAKR